MLDNYRPISILPVVSKLIERILYNQLSKYLEKESILSEYQFGFRSSHSTTTTLLDCSNEWYVNMDRGQYNLVVFLDIKKAFDTVNHDILLKKLEMYGLGDSALALLRNYLTDRTQKCQLQDMLSKQRKITCGIPVQSKYKQYLEYDKDSNKVKWKDSLENLKSFVAELFGDEGQWISPGGNAKSFRGNQIWRSLGTPTKSRSSFTETWAANLTIC